MSIKARVVAGVRGPRTCKNCGGPCGMESWRTAGKRRAYYCRALCARADLGSFWGCKTWEVDVFNQPPPSNLAHDTLAITVKRNPHTKAIDSLKELAGAVATLVGEVNCNIPIDDVRKAVHAGISKSL